MYIVTSSNVHRFAENLDRHIDTMITVTLRSAYMYMYIGED